MFVVIVGCGRVGSAIAKSMLAEGNEVSVLDEDPDAIALLNRGAKLEPGSWSGLVPRSRSTPSSTGCHRARRRLRCPPRRQYELVIAQIAKRRFEVDRVVVRVLDPARARWYAEQGLQTVCPTQTAIELLEAAVRGQIASKGCPAKLMYVLIVGAGKVGWNLARELLQKGHRGHGDRTDQQRYAKVEEELEHSVQYGDGTELWVLERAGIERADLVIAVTGDDEDNILICQVAREKYGVDGSSPAATTPATSSTSSCSASSRRCRLPT